MYFHNCAPKIKHTGFINNQLAKICQLHSLNEIGPPHLLRPVHNIRSGKCSIICLRHVATGSAYKMIWTCVTMCAYAGIEIISIPAYVTYVQIILYALLVAMFAEANIVNGL